MIKNLSLTIISFIAFAGLSAQTCTPDTSINTHGYFPAELDTAQEMSQYNMTMHVFSKRDTMVDNPFGGGQVAATIDSILVKQVSGMPAGLNYACNPRDCRFVTLKTHCINIYGVPEQLSAGVYPLRIVVDVKARINGTFPVTQEEEITDFSIIVKDDNISAIDNGFNQTKMNIAPNPFVERLDLTFTKANSGVVKITNQLGQLVHTAQFGNTKDVEIDTKLIKSGIYFITVELEDGTIFSEKIIKS
jgi:hypothetical protein